MQATRHRWTRAVTTVALCIASATLGLGCDLIAPEEDVEKVMPIDSVGASDSVALSVRALRTPEAWTSGEGGDACGLLEVCPSDLPDGRGQP